MLNSKSFFVSADGGTIDFVTAEGEVIASIAVPAGRVRASEYLELLPDGAEVELSEGLTVLNARGRIGVQHYGAAAFESGANPDFRPTSASRMEREMRVTLNRMQAATTRLEAREKALATIERVPQVKPAAEAEVIEKDDPAPKAEIPAAEAVSVGEAHTSAGNAE